MPRHFGVTVLTAQLVKGLLRICVSVTALANMTGLQLNGGLDRGDWLLAGLQVHAGKQGQASSARLILNPLIKSCPPRLTREKKKTFVIRQQHDNKNSKIIA